MTHQLTSNYPAGAFKLLGLNLQESIFRSKSEEEEELAITFNVNINYSTAGNVIRVLMRVTLSTSKPDIFHLEVAMQGKFERQNESVTMPVEEFSNIIAASIIFPYIRDHVSSLTAKSGINPIMLPLINFIQLYDESKKQQEQ